MPALGAKIRGRQVEELLKSKSKKTFLNWCCHYKWTVGIMSSHVSPISCSKVVALSLAENVAGMVNITYNQEFQIIYKSALDPCFSGSRFDNTCWIPSGKEGLLSRYYYLSVVLEIEVYLHDLVFAQPLKPSYPKSLPMMGKIKLLLCVFALLFWKMLIQSYKVKWLMYGNNTCSIISQMVVLHT